MFFYAYGKKDILEFAPVSRSTLRNFNARGRQSRPYAATNLRRKRAASQKAGWVLLK